MDVAEKLEILADAAKYDVACTSSGVDRNSSKGKLGSTMAAGCCHSFTPDGRCVSLLKILMTNSCIYDCAYCVNRSSNDVRRAMFTPQEIADLTIAFYRRNYIEGLFLSSGVVKSPTVTTELMAQTLRILRDDYEFRGYIHVKVIPGTDQALIDEVGRLADRVSVNMELPSQKSLAYLAPDKSKESILDPMKYITTSISNDKDLRSLPRSKTYYLQSSSHALSSQRRSSQRAFAPAGQSTQIIIGATPETDHHILTLASSLYSSLSLKRVFFSAYIPVMSDKRLPHDALIPLDREHRLYQADWLLRFYGFSADELLSEEQPHLDIHLDPKTQWALNNLDMFPIEVNTARYEQLLRVPGIGVKGAKLIVSARKYRRLGEAEIKRLGIAYTRARFFITCNGSWALKGLSYNPDTLRSYLKAPIAGGKHGRRSGNVIPGQLSLFDDNTSSHTLTTEPLSYSSSLTTDATTCAHKSLVPEWLT